jgi:hypothetical protein
MQRITMSHTDTTVTPISQRSQARTPNHKSRLIEIHASGWPRVHGVWTLFSDPARFSMAHGGKNGHPFPVPLPVDDERIRVLKRAIEHAKLGNDERLDAIRRLDQQARLLEGRVAGPAPERFIAVERGRAQDYCGRTVSP